MRFVPVETDEARTAALLGRYYAERIAGFPHADGYRVVRPDPAAFRPPAGLFLRLDDESEAVGCGGLRHLEPDEDGPRLELKHLFVVPTARGLGLGRLLLTELEARARALRAASLVLDTNASLTAAGALYTSARYTSVPPYNDNPNATHWYRKLLG